MKIKFLAVLGLAAVAGFAGCKGAANTAVTNTTNTTTTTTTTNMNMAASTPMATPAMADTATKATVEDALKKKGITGVTVDATTTGVTLRGTVAKNKMAEAVQVAQEAGKKPVKNELSEMK